MFSVTRLLSRNRALLVLFFVWFLVAVLLLSDWFSVDFGQEVIWNKLQMDDGRLPSDMGKSLGPGLRYSQGKFYLDGREFFIASGAVHYFRIPKEYWHDRLYKVKVAGLNTVETYVAWNLHEPAPGQFVFDDNLNLKKFLSIAHELGLYAIVRPGPYICAEWDNGGIPGWVTAHPQVKIRSLDEKYLNYSRSYLKEVRRHLEGMLYGQPGGNIIGWQVENEYTAFATDERYMTEMVNMFRQLQFDGLLFTSDNHLAPYRLAGVMTALNFQSENGQRKLEDQLAAQNDADMPKMCMEFWSGWFDYWSHSSFGSFTPAEYEQRLQTLVNENYTGINLYMFHGGTNFGFMNGANALCKPHTTSYDYDAPIGENGEMREKLFATRRVMDTIPYVSMIGLSPP